MKRFSELSSHMLMEKHFGHLSYLSMTPSHHLEGDATKYPQMNSQGTDGPTKSDTSVISLPLSRLAQQLVS